MTTAKTSINDLIAAIEWLNAYDRADEIDAMADSLISVIAYMRDDIAKRYAKQLERETIADLKAEGKQLTPAGKDQLRKLCVLKGIAFAGNIVTELDRESLVVA